jgi:phosphoserine phosphatase RsbU/P
MLMTQAASRTLIEHGENDPVAFVATLNRLIYKNIQRIQVDRTMMLVLAHYAHGQVCLTRQHEEILIARRMTTWNA